MKQEQIKLSNPTPARFCLLTDSKLGKSINKQLKIPKIEMTFRQFPDGETYMRIHDDVKGKSIIIYAELHQPDSKILPLYFLSKTLVELGAEKIILVAPYLPYMRQDKVFKEGEAVTVNYFSEFVSQFIDLLITVDPHLHRIKNLNDIYSIPCKVLKTSSLIAKWIKENIKSPVLLGPDSESKQWVKAIADMASVPFIVLNKKRLGDKKVEISIPQINRFKDCTPVIIDDIISTAQTMIATSNHMQDSKMKPAVCIGIHAIFSGEAYQQLLDSGVQQIVTCNAIPHLTNKIDLTSLIVHELL